MANPKFSDLSNYSWDFLKNGPTIEPSKWPMPVNIIADELSIVHRGQFGEFAINQVCLAAGLNVVPYSGKGRRKPYNLLINDSRVKIKIAFESKEITWTFNQIIEPSGYDYLCCLGMCPNSDGELDGKCFVFHSEEVQELINTQGFSFQHPGEETWNWVLSSKQMPNFYHGKGSLAEAVEILAGNSSSEWGRVATFRFHH